MKLMTPQMINRLLREAYHVLSLKYKTTESYREICRRFVYQHGGNK